MTSQSSWDFSQQALMITSDQGIYRNLFSVPTRPQYLKVAWNTLKSFRGFVGFLASIGIIDLLLWRFPLSSNKIPPILFRLPVVLVIALGFFLVVSFIVYHIQLSRHVTEIKRRSVSLRRILLRRAGIDDSGSNADCAYKILGIADHRGDVRLVVELEENSGLKSGSRLDVITVAGGELWGVVRVDVVSNNRAWARPVDRRNREFWEHLEDVMKYNPSPPEGVYLVPAIPQGSRDLLLSLAAERE